ncbi:nicastrin [Periophthalmus magnuspinnatus]|uniref:nicastrin n=1 Tax=Periophthalmus magnuspinnatus TaxID=409849 RepID=UPI00145B0BD1|nr:nicastrin [Periophthalmus magnuspinnatus]
MDLSLSRVFIVFVSCFICGVVCNSVEKKIYVDLNYTVPCVRLLNATHQIGCQSSLSGDVGVIHFLESEQNLDWVLNTGHSPPYMVVLEGALFNRSIMMKLKNSSGRVAGVAVIEPNTNLPGDFSPHTQCPNENTGVYTEQYDPAYAHCNRTLWNPLGNGLSYEQFHFPIFSLKDDNDTQVIRQCFQAHNLGVNGSAPEYPLCAMQLFSHMSAVTDTPTCIRRNKIQNDFSISPEKVCDPLGGVNVWTSTRLINNTDKGHKKSESVVIAAARLDSRSFFFDLAPGAQSSASGVVALLAAAQALKNMTEEMSSNTSIIYALFEGETFDYIGSSKMVYDMETQQFAVDMDNVHSVLEVGQVGLRSSNSPIWLHSDPVSRRNSSVDEEVRRLILNLQTAAKNTNVNVSEPDASQPLPPSSFQRFLRARPLPGIVIQDHQSVYTNRYYESMFDNPENLNMTYPPDLSPDEQFNFVTETAKALTDVATLVAQALFLQAGGDAARASSITANPKTVSQLLYGFLVKSKNPWFEQIIPSDFASRLVDRPTNFYTGVHLQKSEASFLVEYILANLTGTVVNVTQENCKNQRENEDDKDNKYFYSYSWVQGALAPNSSDRQSFCVRSSVRTSPAISPAFDLELLTSSDYSTWTESRWKKITGRIFLVASHDLEMLTLGVGIGILLLSLLLTYIISSKADILFCSGREPTNATY